MPSMTLGLRSTRTCLLPPQSCGTRADATAAAALKPYSEAVVVLLDAFEAARRRKPAKQLELFLFGDGEQFARP
jgi:hypothetical protein